VKRLTDRMALRDPNDPFAEFVLVFLLCRCTFRDLAAALATGLSLRPSQYDGPKR